MLKPSEAQLKDFLSSLSDCWVSDYQQAKTLGVRHLRGGKLKREDSKEGAGTEVLAFGLDELGNVCAWCSDGHKRQFIR